MKILLKILFMILTVAFVWSCSDNSEIKKLREEVSALEKRNQTLQLRIDSLKNSDFYTYQKILDIYNNDLFYNAFNQSEEFIQKYPGSQYVAKIRLLISEIEEKEKSSYQGILKAISDLAYEESIEKLKLYSNQNHFPVYISKVKEKLNDLEKRYETSQKEKESEKETGVKLIFIDTEWDWSGEFGNKLLSPKVKLKFKNISDKPIERMEVKISYLNTATKEVFGEDWTYVIGYSDTPLQPGYSKTAYLRCSVGYTSSAAVYNLPSLVGDIYVNDIFYKKINIEKEYKGVKY